MQAAGDEPPRSTPRIGTKVLGLTGIVGVVGATSYLAFGSARAGETSFWLLAGAPSLVLALVALAWGWRRADLREWMRPKAGDFSIGFLGAGFVFVGAYAFSKVVTPPGSPRAIWLARLYLQLGDPGVLRGHPTALFAGFVLIAAAEEIVWRGLVTSLLRDVLSRGEWAWIVSAGLYALAYVPTMWSLAAPGALNPLLPIAALGAGLVWGGMVRYVGRLPPAIVSHALFDWCVVVMFRLWGESL